MPPLPLLRDERVIEAPVDQSTLTERYTDEAVKFIHASKDKPFFLYLPHTAVHNPRYPGKAFLGKSNNGVYGDSVEEMDWSVGKVMDTVRELKHLLVRHARIPAPEAARALDPTIPRSRWWW